MLPFLEIISDIEIRDRVEELYYEHRKLLCKIAKNYVHDEDLAEDAVQETFVYIAEKCETLDLSNDKKVKGLLATVTQGNAIKLFNKNVKNDDLTTNIIMLEKFDDDSSEDEYFNKFSVGILQRAIDSLDDKYKIPLYLHKIYEVHYKEIAEILGITEVSARQRVHVAKKLIKEKAEKEVVIYE
ncbi:MAG: sigma-70 family RNA polymerase sigma factor [Eubacterium sp.]|nr:sigma-70 family RNA polymerase sigma factor [Eubacterium sp.]